MHLSWERLSLSGYFEALEAHNEAHDPERSKARNVDAATLDRLSRFNKAHGVH